MSWECSYCGYKTNGLVNIFNHQDLCTPPNSEIDLDKITEYLNKIT
jgi:hypothetical protein